MVVRVLHVHLELHLVRNVAVALDEVEAGVVEVGNVVEPPRSCQLKEGEKGESVRHLLCGEVHGQTFAQIGSTQSVRPVSLK